MDEKIIGEDLRDLKTRLRECPTIFSREDLESGTDTIGGYEVIKLKEGGLGVTYKVFSVRKKKFVVLKVSKKGQGVDPGEILFGKKQGEKKLLLSSFLKTHYTGSDIIISEFCERGDLRKKKYARRVIEKHFEKLLGAVGELHRNNIAHRDIKPANIFVRKNGWAVLGDFGLAKEIPSEDRIFGKAGTPYYNSPGLLLKRKTSLELNDAWALGITFYECIVGKHPFKQLGGFGEYKNKEARDIYCKNVAENIVKHPGHWRKIILEELNGVVPPVDTPIVEAIAQLTEPDQNLAKSIGQILEDFVHESVKSSREHIRQNKDDGRETFWETDREDRKLSEKSHDHAFPSETEDKVVEEYRGRNRRETKGEVEKESEMLKGIREAEKLVELIDVMDIEEKKTGEMEKLVEATEAMDIHRKITKKVDGRTKS
ncbi:MAG: protein kinase [Rickettsiales bacterium]|jgi:serine/threonine protein kinase|nr:protein kinase [Rickettsiales bacterium]